MKLAAFLCALLLGIGSAAAQGIGPYNSNQAGGVAPGKQAGGGGSGTVNTGTTNAIAVYPSSGTAVSPVATANSSVLVTDVSGNPSLATTLPSALTIPSPTMTGTTTTAGISDTGGINTTATVGYKFNGNTVLTVAAPTDPNAALIVGTGAGAAVTSTTTFDTFIGTGAGHSYNGTAAGEIVLVGPKAGYSLVSGAVHDDFFGVYAGYHETTGGTDSCFGGDCMRNTSGVSNGTAFGSFTYANFWGQLSTAVGSAALVGNSSSITFTGTVTTADVITLTFTCTCIAGGVGTQAYTVQGGDTVSSIASGLATAMGSNSPLLTADIFAVTDITSSPGTVGISYPGTAAIAPTLVVTEGCVGTCSTVATITGGTTATANEVNFFGYESGHGLRMTSASRDNCMGSYSCVNFTTALGVNCFGDKACENVSTGAGIVAVGDSALKTATTGSDITVLGANAAANCTICATVTAIGYNAGSSTLAGGTDIIILSQGSSCDTNTSHRAIFCGQGGTWFQLNGMDTASTAIAMHSGSLQVGSVTALTLANGEFGLMKETASGTAPGAAGLKLTVVCGTGGGSAKLIAYAGTSTTPVTVLDNIGSGVTGC